MTISILLVDDHEVFREGLRHLLQTQADFIIVGEAINSQQVITLTPVLRPDVVILDIAMPGLSGLDAIQYIRAAHPPVRIIILSAHSDEHYAFRALQLGAVGYVLKEQSAAELIRAIRESQPAHPYLSPAIADQVSQMLGEPDNPEPRPERRLGKRFMLTRREEQVMDCLILGKTNRDIAEVLGISVRTVEVYRTSLMRKLGLNSRAELDRFISQKGSNLDAPAKGDETVHANETPESSALT